MYSIIPITISDIGLSDHYAVLFNICDKKPPSIKKTKFSRNITDINLKSFKADVQSTLSGIDCTDVNQFSETVESKLTTVLDSHAPVTSKTFTVRPNTH